MKPSRVDQVLTRVLSLRWPAFLWGPPGVGKSSVVRSVAARAGLPVRDLRASLLDPTDLRGLPAIENGRAIWCPPVFLPTPEDAPGVLFLDEINAAPPLVQASLYQLILDRQVGEYRLPDGWRIVAAGNRQNDRAVVFRMSSALANRFIHLDFEADYADWRAWAVATHVHPWVIGFLGLRPSLLLQEPDDVPAYPTPRSWEMASDVLKTSAEPGDCADILPGIVGEAAAVEFQGWMRTALREADLTLLLTDPEGAPIPNSLGDLHALTAWFGARGSEKRVRSAAAQLLPRLPIEFAVVLTRDMIRASATFISESGYKSFAKAHGDILRA